MPIPFAVTSLVVGVSSLDEEGLPDDFLFLSLIGEGDYPRTKKSESLHRPVSRVLCSGSQEGR